MTVDEAIAKLQEISAQGNGHLDLAFYVSPERKVVWYQEVRVIEIETLYHKERDCYYYGEDEKGTPFVKLDY